MFDWESFFEIIALVAAAALFWQNLHLRRARARLAVQARELEAKNLQLQQLAVTDGLTGLYNYQYFCERLAEEVSRCERYQAVLSVAMVDLDYFKLYNDTYGHVAGNRLLQEIGGLLRKCVRETDVVARYGGDEFAIIFVEMEPAVAHQVGERIRKAVEKYASSQAGETTGRTQKRMLSLSVGIASYPKDATSEGELLQKADLALYQAKQSRNRVVVYQTPLGELAAKNKTPGNAGAYDAMLSPRPYRRALNPPEALEELHRGAGTQFDPELVQTFSDIVSELREAEEEAEVEGK